MPPFWRDIEFELRTRPCDEHVVTAQRDAVDDTLGLSEGNPESDHALRTTHPLINGAIHGLIVDRDVPGEGRPTRNDRETDRSLS